LHGWQLIFAALDPGTRTRATISQVTDRAQAARQKIIRDQEMEREGNQFYQISVVYKSEKNMGKVRRASDVGVCGT